MPETIHYRFLLRGGTAAALAARNEVPLARELVVETDTGKMKLGNGSTAFNDLPYLTNGGGGGATWRTGTGVPSDGLGSDGDYYLDNATGDVYERALGAYSIVANIKGADGDDGDPGASAYEIAVANGFSGSEAEWLASLQGAPGSSESAIVFGGGDRVNFVTLGPKAPQPIDFAATILRWRLLTDNPSGSISIDLRKCAFAAYPPTAGDSIVDAAPPVLALSDHDTDSTLSGWLTAISAGDVVLPVITSISGVRWWNLTLHIQKA